MTKEEYEEMRNTIDSVGEYFNSIEELTKVRDLVEEVDASNNMAILESPVKLDISLQGICRVAKRRHHQVSRCRSNPLHQKCHPPKIK